MFWLLDLSVFGSRISFCILDTGMSITSYLYYVNGKYNYFVQFRFD